MDGFWSQKSTKICSWTTLGPSCGCLGPSWAVLEGSWDVLRGLQDGQRPLKTAKRRPKSRPRADFGGFFSLNPSKLVPGTHPGAVLCGNRVKAKKYYFRNIIWIILLLPWNIFSIKIHTKSISDAYFLRHAAQMHPKCIKSATWGLQEALQTPPGRLKTDFASVLGANLRPSWRHVGHFSRLRRFLDASKTIQDALQNPFDRPRWPERPPNLRRSPPNLDFGRFFNDFWSILDWFLVHFGSIFYKPFISFQHSKNKRFDRKKKTSKQQITKKVKKQNSQRLLRKEI